MAVVEIEDRVIVEYTGTLRDGTEFDTTIGGSPLEFIVGTEEVIPGFNDAVLGMSVGERKTVTIPCDKAYGTRKEDRVIELPRSQFPAEVHIRIGGILKMRGPEGKVINMRVIETKPESIILDANHPLAGQDLQYSIRVLSIR